MNKDNKIEIRKEIDNLLKELKELDKTQVNEENIKKLINRLSDIINTFTQITE